MVAINYKILKITHQTAQDARSIEHHIRTADIVSPENACLSEQQARADEKFHLKVLRLPQAAKSRQIQRIHSEQAAIIEDSFAEYNDELTRLLFTYSKPMIYAERWAGASEAQLIQSRASESMTMDQSINTFFEGHVEEALQNLFAIMCQINEFTNLRDCNIASNIFLMQQRISELYPGLIEKETLEHLIIIGRAHRPEKYIAQDSAVRVSCIEMRQPGGFNDWYIATQDAIEQHGNNYEATKENLARFLLQESFLRTIHGQGPHHLKRSLSTLLVANMGSEEAEDISRRLAATTMRPDKLRCITRFFEEKGVPIPRETRDYERLWKTYKKTYKNCVPL